MAVTKYQFLDEAGVQSLAQDLLSKVNIRVAERIVTTVDASSDDNHVASAKTMYTMLNQAGADVTELEGKVTALTAKVNGFTHLTIQTVIGDIDEQVTEPSTSVMYFQKDNEEDKTWVIYIYATVGETPSWVVVGDTSIDLVNYWAKTDIDEMKTALGIHDAEALPAATITAKVEAAFAATNPLTPAE